MTVTLRVAGFKSLGGQAGFCGGKTASRVIRPAAGRGESGSGVRLAALSCDSRAVLRVALIVNPKAGSGAGGRHAPDLKVALERASASATLFETKGPGDARRIAESCRGGGFDVIGVIGGDGTLNEVSQAYLDRDGKPVAGPPLAVLPLGTGGDFRKTLGLGTKLDEAVERLLTSEPRAFDLGVLRVTTHDGASEFRAFVNIASFGLGGLTDRIVNEGPKWLGGKAAFFLGTLRGLVAYRNAAVRVKVDGALFLEAPVVNVAIANGRYFGGGMLIAPDADPHDGRLDVVALGDLTKLQTVGLTQRVYAGTHVGQPGVTATRGSVVEAEALVPNEHVLIDMDGETPGRLPLVAHVAPSALWLRA
jgi:diacylglycerol kinase (ATP)